VLYATYVMSKGTMWIMLIQAFHGLAYVFFMIGGQIFVGAMAPQEIGASAQSLIFIATNGIGLFLGTQLAGIVMERNTVGGKFQWSKIWAVPLGITLAGAIAFAVLFRVPDPNEFKKDTPKPQVGEFGEVFLPLLPKAGPVYTPAPKGTVSLWRA
jgi:MFS family permease